MALGYRKLILPLVIALLVATSVAGFGLVRSMYVDLKLLAAEPVSWWRYAEDNERLATQGVRPDLVLFGDSRIAQWSPLPNSGAGKLVVNRGIGGETTGQMVQRFERDVLDLEPVAVLIQAGVNDLVAASLSDDPAVRDRIVERCKSNIATLVEQASSRGIRVLVLAIWPTGRVPLYRLPFWNGSIVALIQDVNRSIAALDDGESVSVVTLSTALADDSDTLLPEFARDALHLNPAGYARVNEQLTPLLQVMTQDAVQ